MSDLDAIGLVRDHRWLGAAEQAKRLEADGCRVVLALDDTRKMRQATREDVEKFARKGTTFKLVHAFLLADTRKRRKVALKADFCAWLKRLVDKGGAVLKDVDMGLTTERHRKAIVAVADDMIARHCQGARSAVNGQVQRGRQLVEFTPQQLKEAKAIWRDTVEYPTWHDARTALAEIVSAKGEKFTTDRARRLWQSRKSKRT
jgi:hypothetical protein